MRTNVLAFKKKICLFIDIKDVDTFLKYGYGIRYLYDCERDTIGDTVSFISVDDVIYFYFSNEDMANAMRKILDNTSKEYYGGIMNVI